MSYTLASLTKADTAVMPTKDVNVTFTFYKRCKNHHHTSSPSLPHMSGKGSSPGYSAGLMAGLAIAMLILGVASGCLVMILA